MQSINGSKVYKISQVIIKPVSFTNHNDLYIFTNHFIFSSLLQLEAVLKYNGFTADIVGRTTPNIYLSVYSWKFKRKKKGKHLAVDTSTIHIQ